MLREIESEVRGHRERCEALHESFKQRLKRRDEARAALWEAEERIEGLQQEGVSLLGSLNRAMVSGDEDRLRKLEGSHKENSRGLVRARKNRENAVRRLKEADLDEVEAARELRQAVLEVLESYASHVGERRERLETLMDTLKERQGELAQTAAPIIAEYEKRRPVEQDAWENQG